jgi:hypothetical protein
MLLLGLLGFFGFWLAISAWQAFVPRGFWRDWFVR